MMEEISLLVGRLKLGNEDVTGGSGMKQCTQSTHFHGGIELMMNILNFIIEKVHKSVEEGSAEKKSNIDCGGVMTHQ